MVPLECIQKAIDYFYTGKWREDAGKLVMQKYMVTFKELITGVGYVNLRDVVPIRTVSYTHLTLPTKA